MIMITAFRNHSAKGTWTTYLQCLRFIQISGHNVYILVRLGELLEIVGPLDVTDESKDLIVCIGLEW